MARRRSRRLRRPESWFRIRYHTGGKITTCRQGCGSRDRRWWNPGNKSSQFDPLEVYQVIIGLEETDQAGQLVQMQQGSCKMKLNASSGSVHGKSARKEGGVRSLRKELTEKIYNSTTFGEINHVRRTTDVGCLDPFRGCMNLR